MQRRYVGQPPVSVNDRCIKVLFRYIQARDCVPLIRHNSQHNVPFAVIRDSNIQITTIQPLRNSFFDRKPPIGQNSQFHGQGIVVPYTRIDFQHDSF